MASIRSKILRGSALVSFVFLFSACSEKATCALEGCTTDSSVKLQSDSQASEDARPDELAAAKAEIEKAKKALEDAFAELKDRVIFNESVDKLQNDMLHLHEQRIAALELRVSAIDTKIVAIEGDIIANTADIAANAAAILKLEEDLTKAILDGNAALKADLEEQLATLKAQQDRENRKLARRVRALEAFRRAQECLNETMGSKIGTLQGQVTGLLATIGSMEDPANNTTVFGLIKTLQGSVSEVNDLVADLRGEIPGMLDTLEASIQGDVTDAKNDVIAAIAAAVVEAKGYVDGEISRLEGAIDDIEDAMEKKSECTYGTVRNIVDFKLGSLKLKINVRDITCDGNKFSVIVP